MKINSYKNNAVKIIEAISSDIKQLTAADATNYNQTFERFRNHIIPSLNYLIKIFDRVEEEKSKAFITNIVNKFKQIIVPTTKQSSVNITSLLFSGRPSFKTIIAGLIR